MKNIAIILLALFIASTFALTGCGTSCSDACGKKIACDYNVSLLDANCEYFCEQTSDCMTNCDTDQDCVRWIRCVAIECMYWF